MLESNISSSIIAATTRELNAGTNSTELADSIVHAMLSPTPSKIYFVGSVDLVVPLGFASIKIHLPLWIWKQFGWLNTAFASTIKEVKSISRAVKRAKKGKKKSNKHNSKKRVINPANTYEHLALKG